MAEQKDSVQGKALLSVRIIQILYRESDEAHPRPSSAFWSFWTSGTA